MEIHSRGVQIKDIDSLKEAWQFCSEAFEMRTLFPFYQIFEAQHQWTMTTTVASNFS
jgi:hypothetical protein